jgi:hypothetical protein
MAVAMLQMAVRISKSAPAETLFSHPSPKIRLESPRRGRRR